MDDTSPDAPSKADIRDDAELTIAVRVIDIEEWDDHDSIAYKLKCRDIARNGLDVAVFRGDGVPVDKWDRGQWYELTDALGNVYRDERSLTLNYGNATITALDEPPRVAEQTGGSNGDETVSVVDISSGPVTDTIRSTREHTSVPDAGTYLSQFQVDVPDELSVHRYDVDASGNGWAAPGQVVNKVAANVWRRTGIPTAQYDEFAIVTTLPLEFDSISTYDTTARLRDHETVKITSAGNPGVVKGLVEDAIKNALIDDGQYSVGGIDDIETLRPRHRSDDGRFEAADQYDIGIRVDSAGNVLASVEVSYSLRSGVSVAELLDSDNIQLPGLFAEHVPEYDYHASGRIAYVDREVGYTDPHPELGGESVADYHRRKERAPEPLIDEVAAADPPLVYIYYSNGDDPRPQAPHFLRLSPSLDVLSALDGSFLNDLTGEMKQTPEQRFERASWFADEIGDLPEVNGSISARPTNGAYIRSHAEDVVSSPNLEFAGGRLATFGRAGLTDYGVYQAPERFDLLTLVPEPLSDAFDRFWRKLRATFDAVGATPDSVDVQEYGYGTESDYSRVAGRLSGYDAALVAVPNRGQAEDFPGLEDPFDELKRTLGHNGVGSQMVEQENLRAATDGVVRNVAAGLIGAAGGVPWRIAEMPGEADCFIGLDVTYDHERDQHRGAAATITHADGTVYASRSYAVQSGEKFHADDARRMFNDLLNEYESAHGEPPGHAVVHRDGRLYEEVDGLIDPFQARDTALDIVEVKKSKIPRIAEFDGDGYRRASKGSGLLDIAQRDAVLVTTGGKEHRIGTPQPIRLNHRHGDTPLDVLAAQAYWLSEAHVGSVSRSTRLPITTHYADKYAQHVQEGFLASDEVIRGLPFL